MTYTFKAKSVAQMDRVEAQWRTTFGTGIINRAVEIVRTETTLTITNEQGHVMIFQIKS